MIRRTSLTETYFTLLKYSYFTKGCVPAGLPSTHKKVDKADLAVPTALYETPESKISAKKFKTSTSDTFNGSNPLC